MKKKYKSGFVTLIGRPNVGKSTLMNHLIGQKIAITSDKPADYQKQDPDRLTLMTGDRSFSLIHRVSTRQKTSWASIWSMWLNVR